MSRRVLLTGAGGFLGAATDEALRLCGYDVIGMVRPGGRASSRPGARSCDLSDAQSLSRFLDSVKPDAIVNCAAVIDFKPDTLQAQLPVNARAPELMAEWAARHSAYFVQASTAAICGARTERIDAASAVRCDTDYARSKFFAEQAIAVSGCRAAVLRFGGIYGRGGPAHLGLNQAIDRAAAGVPPTLVGAGSARRNYVHVRDAAAATVHCLRDDLIGVHLCAGPEVLTIREMLELVCARYLPGIAPVSATGHEASDQVIEPSPALPPGRPMRDLLRQYG